MCCTWLCLTLLIGIFQVTINAEVCAVINMCCLLLKQMKSEKKRNSKKDSDNDDDDMPDYANFEALHRVVLPEHPPPKRPPPGATVVSSIDSKWAKYLDDDSSCHYYYNATTGESTWQPPLTDKDNEAKDISANSSQLSVSSVRKLLLYFF